MEYPKNNSVEKLKHDGQVMIATGKSKTEMHWKNKNMQYSALLEKLAITTRTPETAAEYKKSSKAEKDSVKDVGGFVGGSLKNGRRKAENVQNRSLLTLDLDYVKGDIWASIELMWDFAVAMYSTHSHSPESPRLRIIIPLSRPVLPDEYQAIARMIADELGIDQFDDTTYEPCRLMYWPSTSQDGEYVFRVQDLPWLDPDAVLARYTFGWQDISYWPESSRARAKLISSIKKQEDPLEKKGVIGAFCRTYDIHEAISTFLPDTYIAGADGARYTYADGSTSGGVVIYEDKFSFSHHGTDPASGILCNAFDLVRLHKFGELDDESAAKGTNMPSHVKMRELAAADGRVRIQLGHETMGAAVEEFEKVESEDEDSDTWLGELSRTDKGLLRPTPENFALIISNDTNLKGKIAYNEFSNRICVHEQLPWRKKNDLSEWKGSDDSSLRVYLSRIWNITSKQNCDDGLNEVIMKNSFHPVREYLSTLSWDGVPRIDKLLIDYMGAADEEYTRLVTRKWLCGAVARILKPGIKFDTMLVLTGDQGIYKSTFFKLLAGEWFTDSLQEVEGNQAVEKLMNSWIVEFGELQAFSKSESNAIKRFVSSQEDRTRLAYERRSAYLKRQCVFAGTTNKFEFLKDVTGERRYWPIEAKKENRTKSVIEDLKKERDQIWAEALHCWNQGERIYLTEDQETLAKVKQEQHREINEKEGILIDYLEKLVPSNWDDLSLDDRRDFMGYGEFSAISGTDAVEGTERRMRVSVLEVWCECFGKKRADMRKSDSLEINNIMRSIKGWSYSGKLVKIKGYGPQRVYIREV